MNFFLGILKLGGGCCTSLRNGTVQTSGCLTEFCRVFYIIEFYLVCGHICRKNPKVFHFPSFSHLLPFITLQVGGLGDVVTSLSRAVQDLNHNVDIILPKYDCLNLTHVSFIAVTLARFSY